MNYELGTSHFKSFYKKNEEEFWSSLYNKNEDFYNELKTLIITNEEKAAETVEENEEFNFQKSEFHLYYSLKDPKVYGFHLEHSINKQLTQLKKVYLEYDENDKHNIFSAKEFIKKRLIEFIRVE